MRLNWPMVLGAWLAMVLLLMSPSLQGQTTGLGNDDVMRMVQTLDLLNGQAWNDTTSYRDNTPFGAGMHWSRLVDAPIAGLILVLTPVVGMQASAVAAFVWPLLLLFGFFALLMGLSDRLGGQHSRIPAMALAVLALPIYTDFAPGRVDHHNVQILLTLALIWATIAGRLDVRAAVVAGLLAATSLAIGTESLPTVVVAMSTFPILWLADPMGQRRQAAAFALSFSLAATVHLLIAVPWTALWRPACDALSISYVTAAILYATGVSAALLTSSRSLLWRLGALAGAGIAVLVAVGLLYPTCLGGPYGDIDPKVAFILLTDIDEALPAWKIWEALGPASLSLLVLPITGMLAAGLACLLVRDEKRIDWMILLAFSVVLVVVMLLQVRGLRLATAPALPAGAWLITVAWKRFQTRQSLKSAGLVLLTSLAFTGAAHFALAKGVVSGGVGTGGAASDQCVLPDRYDRLAALPPGRIISFLLMGPQILYYTHHSIVGGGYHRNPQGLLDAARFFSGNEQDALAVARERGLNYYVYCRDISPEVRLHGLAPFRPVDAQGKLWPWLRPLTEPDEPIQIYAITPPA